MDGVLTAAHELKAPLAVLRQLALSLGDLTPDDEHLRAEMVAVSERAMRQVNDLAKVRRLEDGLFEMEPVAVRAVCDEVTHELKYLFRENQQEIAVRYGNRARLVSANRELLYSVIYNFMVNAMHYAEAGTAAELTVRDVRPVARRGRGRGANERLGGGVNDGLLVDGVRAGSEMKAPENVVRVEVRDYGPALPVGVWRELKRGYVEQPTAIAMRPGSSGLGLYIASKFSRYMNARVGAVRHRDGTSFYVELPVSKQLSML